MKFPELTRKQKFICYALMFAVIPGPLWVFFVLYAALRGMA